jgi:integrase
MAEAILERKNMAARTIRPTARALDALPACPAASKSKATEYSFVGLPGLKALVSKSREITLYHRYVLKGIKRAQRLGRYPDFGLDEAIQKFHENRGVLEHGGDPQEDRDRLKAMPTLEQFVLNDLLPFLFQYKRSANSDESKYRLHVLPKWGSRLICDIAKREIQTYHVEMAKKLSPSTANRHLMLLSKCFSLAQQWGVLGNSSNPCTGIKQFKENIKPLPQLKHIDIAPLFRAMEEDQNKVAIACLKIMLLTGARRAEAQSMVWSALDFEAGLWTISETKSGKTHIVHLNDAARDVLAAIPRTGSPFVFPSRYDLSKCLNNPRKAFDRCLQKAGLPHMRIHSLRHSFCSFAVAAGASLYQVQLLVGHRSVSTTTRYSHLDNQSLRNATQLVSSVVNNAVSGKQEPRSP